MLPIPVKYQIGGDVYKNLTERQAAYFRKLETCRLCAVNNPDKLIKVHAGYYLSYIDGEMIEYDHLDEGPNRGQWIAREVNGHWYSDPFPALRPLHAAHLDKGEQP